MPIPTEIVEPAITGNDGVVARAREVLNRMAASDPTGFDTSLLPSISTRGELVVGFKHYHRRCTLYVEYME